MLTTGLFTIHKIDINVKKTGEPFYLIPFGDIHRSSPMCHERKWLEFIEWAKTKKRAYFLGMGDYDDMASTSEREILGNRKLHDSSIKTLENIYIEHTKRLAKEIKFMDGNIIGLLEGNHYGELQNGATTTQKLCELLNTKYLGVSSFIRLSFSLGQKRASIDIWAHHGKGASRLIGGSLNRVQQMGEAAEADIYCVSDDTEILSENGWRKRGELNIGDAIYSYNLKNNTISSDRVINIIDKPYKGIMYQFKNKNVDMLLSPNHRFVYKQPNSKNWIIKDTKYLAGLSSQITIPLNGTRLYPSVTIEDSLIQLTAWIITEGSFKTSGIRITQKVPEKVEIIRALLKKIDIQFSERIRKDGCIDFYLNAKTRKKIQSIISEKNIPDWVLLLSKPQFDLFLKTLVMGDGYSISDHWGQYYSINENLIDKLQMAMVLNGYRSIKQYKQGGFKNGCWRLLYCEKQTTNLALHKKESIKEKEYNGNIWCVETYNTTIICRRNGKTFITGNCMGHDHKKSVGLVTKLKLNHGGRGLRLCHKKQLYARTGSFLKGYEDDKISYVADMALSPTDLGVVKIELTPKRAGEVFYIDIHASI